MSLPRFTDHDLLAISTRPAGRDPVPTECREAPLNHARRPFVVESAKADEPLPADELGRYKLLGPLRGTAALRSTRWPEVHGATLLAKCRCSSLA
jgi:hypothetical protein